MPIAAYVIGTLARRAVSAGYEVVISTGDKDFAQLVDESIARPAVGFSGAISVQTLPDIVQLYALSGAVFSRVKHAWEIVTPEYVAFVVRLLITGARHGGATPDRRKPTHKPKHRQ